MKEIKTLEEAIKTYKEIIKAEKEHGDLFYAGKIHEQEWNNTVYRVMCFPVYDVNWNEIYMSNEIQKEFSQWELQQRKKRPSIKL